MRRGFRRVCMTAFCIFVIAIIILCVFRARYHGEIRTLAQTQVRNATSDLINDAIDQQIEQGNVQYDRIVYFEKDLNQ